MSLWAVRRADFLSDNSKPLCFMADQTRAIDHKATGRWVLFSDGVVVAFAHTDAIRRSIIVSADNRLQDFDLLRFISPQCDGRTEYITEFQWNHAGRCRFRAYWTRIFVFSGRAVVISDTTWFYFTDLFSKLPSGLWPRLLLVGSPVCPHNLSVWASYQKSEIEVIGYCRCPDSSDHTFISRPSIKQLFPASAAAFTFYRREISYIVCARTAVCCTWICVFLV